MSLPDRPLTLNTGKVRVALGDPDTPGLVLLIIALYEFGDAVFGDPEQGIEPMDPAEMWAELNSAYGTWLTEEGENKLNAIIAGLTDGAFWRDETVFMSVATALFDGDLGDLINAGWEELSATELMWAILEMELAWDSDDIPEYSLNVRTYIEDCLRREQEDMVENTKEIENSYLVMLKQLQDLGIPASMIRAWDEEYADVMERLESGSVE
jgi:hypothetical protein